MLKTGPRTQVGTQSELVRFSYDVPLITAAMQANGPTGFTLLPITMISQDQDDLRMSAREPSPLSRENGAKLVVDHLLRGEGLTNKKKNKLQPAVRGHFRG